MIGLDNQRRGVLNLAYNTNENDNRNSYKRVQRECYDGEWNTYSLTQRQIQNNTSLVRLSLAENGVEIGSHEMETSTEMSSMQIKVYLSDPFHFSATSFNVRNFFLEQYDETCEVSYSGDSCQCPPIYVKQKDSSGSLKRSGTAASDHCIEKGGFLAFFINREEFDDFKINYRHGNEDLWLGYTQKFPQNKNLYVSADGEDARFLKWEPTHNEPNGVTEHCVELYGQNTWLGSRNNMNDRGCEGEQREFFCRFSQQGDCQTKTFIGSEPMQPIKNRIISHVFKDIFFIIFYSN